jgi:hypothetical protein
LDQRDAAIELGAIVPGEPEESEMIRRIFSDSQFEVMPPTTVPHFLTDEEKELLRRWVAECAEYQPHFAFIPPEHPDLPVVDDPQWLDAPVLGELVAHQVPVTQPPARPGEIGDALREPPLRQGPGTGGRGAGRLRLLARAGGLARGGRAYLQAAVRDRDRRGRCSQINADNR